jgi:hypothetical protein
MSTPREIAAAFSGHPSRDAITSYTVELDPEGGTAA